MIRRLAIFLAPVFLAGGADLRVLLEAGHYRKASAAAEERLKSNAGDAEANYALSVVKYKSGDLEGALLPGEKAVALNPKDAEYHSHLAQIYGSQAQAASVFKQLGLARKCRRELDTALVLDPRHFEAKTTLMIFLLKAPGVMGGDKTRARSIPDEISQYDPSGGYMARARLLTEEESKADPGDLYRKAAEANPRSFRAQTSYLNYVLNRTKNFDEAERRARELTRNFPDRFQPYTFLAAAYARKAQWAEMESALKEGQKNCPDNLQPFLNAAGMLLREGQQLKRAESYLNEYLSKEPEYSMPGHFYARWLLGLVYEKQGRKAEAVAEIEKSTRMKPDFENAKKDLKRLRG